MKSSEIHFGCVYVGRDGKKRRACFTFGSGKTKSVSWFFFPRGTLEYVSRKAEFAEQQVSRVRGIRWR